MSAALTFAIAGRFRHDIVEAIARHARASEAGGRCDRWRLAWCYGTLVQSAEGGLDSRGRLDLGGLEEVKTDMALLRLETAEPGRARQPFVRRDRTGPWAFCHDGSVQHPELLDPGNRVAESFDPSERLFLHVLHSFKPEDPAESLRAIHEGLPAEAEQSLVLMSPDVLVASRWQAEAGEPGLWVGEGRMVRLVAPFRLEHFEQLHWTEISNREVLAFTRFRHELE